MHTIALLFAASRRDNAYPAMDWMCEWLVARENPFLKFTVSTMIAFSRVKLSNVSRLRNITCQLFFVVIQRARKIMSALRMSCLCAVINS